MAKKVLFVCTGNTCRSSMAEALARDMLARKGLQGEVEVVSAGIAALPGSEASPQAVAVMEEMGLDLKSHRATLLTRRDVEEADLVLTMTQSHKKLIQEQLPDQEEKIFTLAEYAGRGGDVPDPFGGPVDVYRQCAGELRYLISLALDRLAAEKAGPAQASPGAGAAAPSGDQGEAGSEPGAAPPGNGRKA
ncbi:protein tyrosine phosphatase [Desulfofundulus kuznetsovii DSM 6115]|uniref:Protein tyrosine phosphatase n=1 Tax=Desulfofundulus kuznetsovii (strain DSM 6115 / VKM B-1805 / 17) TaxID=760568 RepID=A0AAU8PFZ2_DESK7|nr:protein tyrosine phosphatase [Desulfofundulus kuznetsovii DSM 6115]